MTAPGMFRAGVDTGGTHTDVVVLDTGTGSYVGVKVPTVPDDPIAGIFDGLGRACAEAGIALDEVSHLVYGTTIVVNMLAQQDRVPVGLVTTHGFRDILEIGRAHRVGNIYDIQMDRPEPLVPREHRFTVRERVDFRGEVLTPLDEAEVHEVAARIRACGLGSVAVCLLHAYRNPEHERRIRRVLAAACPGVHVSLSSDVNPQFREFERASTTVINAFAMPPITAHLTRFEGAMRGRGMTATAYIMQANAGTLSFRAAADRPVQVTNSGPIAGVVAATFLARECGHPNLITLDMGGTSCDVSLVRDGSPTYTGKSDVRGYPVSIPTVDLHCIGAGGGSLAWIDSGGSLRVGPRSAGARPGPACYGLGGDRATVTDANLQTGRLGDTSFLGGRSRLDRAAADRAIGVVAGELGLDPAEVAEGIIDVAVSNMMGAVKLISVERGYDPRDFTLAAFGGAGALHASLLSRELVIPRVLVPPSPGTFTALGTVLADIRYDHVRTEVHQLGERDAKVLQNLFGELCERGARQLDGEGVPPADRLFLAACDVRYSGQGFELPVPVTLPLTGPGDLEGLRTRFDELHARTYGHRMPGAVEVVNLRVTALGRMPKPERPLLRLAAGGRVETAPRDVQLAGRRVRCRVLSRDALPPGYTCPGPAIVEEMGSTTLVLPEHTLTVDPFGNLVLTAPPAVAA